MSDFLNKYRKFRPFSDEEAWTLFKIAAFGEACGWSILISGLLIKHYFTPRSNIPVLLAGQTHGILFLLYIVAAIVLSPSLGWSWNRTFIAGLCSVPPYGSLMFELWAAHRRKLSGFKSLSNLLTYMRLAAKLPEASD